MEQIEWGPVHSNVQHKPQAQKNKDASSLVWGLKLVIENKGLLMWSYPVKISGTASDVLVVSKVFLISASS